MKRRLMVAVLLLAVSLAAIPVFAAETPSAAPDAGIAPVAQNLEIETYRGIAVGGKLEATDPDGDLSGFEITTPPVKGSVEVEADGSFVYTPIAGKRGRDYFGYKAVDKAGNYSQEATVIIKLKKQAKQNCYADMTQHGAHYAALRLAEDGIFCGKTVAGEQLFEPEASVSRTDFLAMCMQITDTELLSGVMRTGFADDEAIAVWAKPYVATALMDGLVSGYSAKGGAVFAPDADISVGEATVLLDRLLHITDVSVPEQDAVTPVWAAQSAANLMACRLLHRGTEMDAPLTRAVAAEMLLSARQFIENR